LKEQDDSFESIYIFLGKIICNKNEEVAFNHFLIFSIHTSYPQDTEFSSPSSFYPTKQYTAMPHGYKRHPGHPGK